MHIDANFLENLPAQWRQCLEPERKKPYFQALASFLKKEYASHEKIFPERAVILRALQEVDYDTVKVVILGQDPYHGEGQAMGRSFAVPNSIKVKPPSLVNIFKEIESDLDVKLNRSQSDLSGWTQQGVLLLNTVLTVRANQAFSHREKGWETFTDEVIRQLNLRTRPMVFLLWGAAAHKKVTMIDQGRHVVLMAPHPSPLSAHRGFLGCRHFSLANKALIKIGYDPIDWTRLSQDV